MTKKGAASKATKTIPYKRSSDDRKKSMLQAVCIRRQKSKRELPLAKHAPSRPLLDGRDSHGQRKESNSPPAPTDESSETVRIFDTYQAVRITPLSLNEGLIVQRKHFHRKLPLSLGRTKLAKLWFQACPNCRHGDYGKIKRSKVMACLDHCLPADIEKDCLSKDVVFEIDDTGNLKIASKNPKIFRIGRKRGGASGCITKTLSIVNAEEEPFMKFRLDILQEEEEQTKEKPFQEACKSDGYISSRKRKHNAVTPSPKDRAEKERRMDDDSACLFSQSQQPTWAFQPTYGAVRRFQEKMTSHKPRSLQFPAKQSTDKAKYRPADMVERGLPDRDSPHKKALDEMDECSLSTPHQTNRSFRRPLQNKRRMEHCVLAKTKPKHDARDSQTSNSDEQVLSTRISPARRKLFAPSEDASTPLKDSATDADETQSQLPSQVAPRQAAIRQTLSCLTDDDYKHEQDLCCGTPKENSDFRVGVESQINATVDCGDTRQIENASDNNVATQDSKQEMIRLLLALKTDANDQVPKVSDNKRQPQNSNARAEDDGTVQTPKRQAEINKDQKELSQDPVGSSNKAIEKYAGSAVGEVLPNAKAFPPSQCKPACQSSMETAPVSGKGKSASYDEPPSGQAKPLSPCGRESDSSFLRDKMTKSQGINSCGVEQSLLHSQQQSVEFNMPFHAGSGQQVVDNPPSQSSDGESPIGTQNDDLLFCQQESQTEMPFKSSSGSPESQEPVQSQQFLSQQMEPAGHSLQQSDGVPSQRPYQQQLVQSQSSSQVIAYKLPSVSFRGLQFECETHDESRNTQSFQPSTTQTSQGRWTPEKCLHESTDNQVESQPIERAGESIESSAASSVLSMPGCEKLLSSSQASLVVLGNDEKKTQFQAGQSQVQDGHEQTLEYWKGLQASGTLRTKSSRTLAKLIIAKNKGSCSSASFWLPTLMDDISSSS
jgi:hypothetical protein